MSHTVTGNIKITNEEALQRVIEEHKLTLLPKKKHQLFEGEYEGVAVKLDGWRYPVIINTETGDFWYDNYNGQWGHQAELDKFIQDYTLQTMLMAAEANNYMFQTVEMDNGDIELICEQIL